MFLSETIRIQRVICVVLATFGSVSACAAGVDNEPGVVPITDLVSGATCPETSTLTYDNFGRQFFATYCTSCHSAAISVNMRAAPIDRNFDDVVMIRALARQIDQQAGVGPRQQNKVMPPGANGPTDEVRSQLAEWLACGAP